LPYREGLPIKEYLSQRPTMPLPYPATDIEASRGALEIAFIVSQF
jgi:hypothetical protein